MMWPGKLLALGRRFGTLVLSIYIHIFTKDATYTEETGEGSKR